MVSWKNYFNNAWNWVHFSGGIIGTWFFYIIGINLLYSCLFTLLIDVLKEILDTVTSKTKYKGRFGFDPSGGDWKDILMCCVGILIASVILLIKIL